MPSVCFPSFKFIIMMFCVLFLFFCFDSWDSFCSFIDVLKIVFGAMGVGPPYKYISPHPIEPEIQIVLLKHTIYIAMWYLQGCIVPKFFFFPQKRVVTVAVCVSQGTVKD